MKWKIIALLLVISGSLWAWFSAGGDEVPEELILKPVPVTSKTQRDELRKLVEHVAESCNRHGPGSLKRVFGYSPKELARYRFAEGADPVTRSIDVLRKHGRNLAFGRLHIWNYGDKGGGCYYVDAECAQGGTLRFTFLRNNRGYRLGEVSELHAETVD